MEAITFEEARQRLDEGSEVWFCFAKHSWCSDIKLSKNILPTRLGDFDLPVTRRISSKDVRLSKRYYVMGKSGSVTKKSYQGYDNNKPLNLYRSEQDCIDAYNRELDKAVSALNNSIERLRSGIRHFESMKIVTRSD